MQQPTFSQLLFAFLFTFIWQRISSTSIYVTPFKSCLNNCTGDLTEPYDNLLFALQAATTLESPVIILLACETADHYVLAGEQDPSDQTILYQFPSPVTLNFTSLEIKPLFCDEMPDFDVSLPSSTNCTTRDQKVTVYLKTLKISIGIQSELKVQNIVFNGIEAISDYISSNSTADLDVCTHQRQRCCPSTGYLGYFNPQDLPPNPVSCEYDDAGQQSCCWEDEYEYWCAEVYPPDYICNPTNSVNNDAILESIFRIDGPEPSSDEIYQEMSFINVDLQYFWGKGIRSFAQVRSSPYFSLIFENCTIDDIFFEQGLTYVYENGDTYETIIYDENAEEEFIRENFWDYSTITFQNMTFSNYNYWSRYTTKLANFAGVANKSFYEGYLLLVQTIFRGTINIIGSNFENAQSVSRRTCEQFDTDPLGYYTVNVDMPARSNLDTLCSNRTNDNFVSSFLYVPQMGGSMIVDGSNFTKIKGVEGSVIRVDDMTLSDDHTFSFTNSIFDFNFAVSRFANILIMRKYSTEGTPGGECPIITISKCQFSNTLGCPGSYGNVGLFCSFEESGNSLSAFFDWQVVNNSIGWANASTVNPQITVIDSVFENNLIGVSNSLAINGSYFTVFERNVFQNNGGPSGTDLIKYSLGLSQVAWRVGYVNNGYVYFGQATALYMNMFYELRFKGNTFKGNWGPFQGSQALGSSLTLLRWKASYFYYYHVRFTSGMFFYMSFNLNFAGDKLIDHVGVPSTFSNAASFNCYTPPIITLANTFEAQYTSPGITFEGLKFANNIASFGTLENGDCNYYEDTFDLSDGLLATFDENSRYRAGIFKFLMPSEVADDGTETKYSVNSTGPDINISIANTEIINNTISSTQGCLFPTLRLRTYYLDNLTIEDNQIRPSVESELNPVEYNQANVDDPLNTRAGVFCLFEKDSVLMTSYSGQVYANNLTIKNNVGPIFSLFPDESTTLYLTKSTFINNTCKRTATIISLDDSTVYSNNNTFLQNFNAYGIAFASSSYFESNFANYTENDGRYASLIYSNNGATANETSAQIYNNTISPSAYLFHDKVTAQGGLYCVASAELNIGNSTFDQNNVSAGFVVSLTGTVLFDTVQVVNHYISAACLLGDFMYDSDLTLKHVNLTNNSIIGNPVSQLQPSLITMFFGNIEITDLTVSLDESNIGIFLYGIKVQGTLTDITLSNFTVTTEEALISLISSDLTVNGLNADYITPFISVSKTEISLNSVSIQRLQPVLNTFYLIDTFDSTLTISNLEYVGGLLDRGNYLSLILCSGSSVVTSELSFIDAVYGNNKIFNLKDSSLFAVVKSFFEYTESDNLPTLFVLDSSQAVVIDNCVFSFTGQIIQDQNTGSDFYFIGNTIIANPYIQKIATTEENRTHILQNVFITSGESSEQTFPTSQIQVVDSSGLIEISNNVFFSLYGSEGIVQIQGLKNSYNMTSTENSFINNVGSLGGAICLEATLPETQLPSASINSSVFLLNNARKIADNSGKGGAIYQTTSNSTQQKTIINNSLFVRNMADLAGGAIFFDFMLPTVDTVSQFRENTANSLSNHVGSYPVKLCYYYGTEISTRSPALPSDTYSRILTSNELYQWDNVPSGLSNDINVTFALLDMFGQVFDSDNTSTLELYPSVVIAADRYLFSNKISITAENGLYVFDSFEFTWKTYETATITFQSTAIKADQQIPLDPPVTTSNSFVIGVTFRGCQRGEYSITNDLTVTCGQCQAGFWQTSPNPDALSCEACDSDSTFCLGGDTVGPRRGYWRLNETSNIVTECPISDSCLGSEEDDTDNIDPSGKCAYGYTGNLCSNCLSGWAKIGNGACTNCNTNVWYYLRVALVLLFQFAMIVKAVQGTIVITKEFNNNQKLGLNGAILIRVLTNYFQLVSLVAGIPVTWPGVVKSLSSASSQISSVTENVFTLDCMFKSDEVYGTKVVFIKILLSTVGPFALVILGVICAAIYFKVKKMPICNNKAFTNQIVALSVIICFMLQPSAIQTAFSLFQCDNLYRSDSPAYFLAKDYNVQCWEGSHIYWAFAFGMPILVIWVFILPFIVFKGLKKQKDQLQTVETSQKYSFLYGGYTYDKYYWELIVMLRKFLLIGITVAASFHSINLEIYVSILLIMFWYFLHEWTQPYAESRLNKLEQLALISAGLVNFCGLYFKFVGRIGVLDVIVIICGLGGNLCFFIYFGLLYFALQIDKLKENKTVIHILNVIGKKCKWINPQKVEKMRRQLSTFINHVTQEKQNQRIDKLDKLNKDLFDEKQNKEVTEEQSPFPIKLSMSFQNDTEMRQENQGDDSPPAQLFQVLQIERNSEDQENRDNDENHESEEGDSLKRKQEDEKMDQNLSLSGTILNLNDVLEKQQQSKSMLPRTQEF